MKNRCIVVLGMHRGGTSALAGTLQALGVDFGEDLLGPQPENPLGFFEHRAVVSGHDALLRAAGATWGEPLPEHSDAGWQRLTKRPLLAVRKRLAADFGRSPVWGLKDPRMGRFLPWWRPLFVELGVVPHYVFILRHPAEVAASLEARNRLDERNARLLWLEHLLAAEAATRGEPRLFLTYDDLLADWRRAVARIGEAFGIAWPRRPTDPAVLAEIDRFLRPTMRHHRAAPSEPSPGSSHLADEVFELFQQTVANAAHPAAELPPAALSALDRHQRLLTEFSWQHTEANRRLRADRARAQEIMEALDAEVKTLRVTERELRDDRAEAQRILDAQTAEVEDLRRDRAERERIHGETIAALGAELTGLRAVVATLRADRTEAQRVIDALHTELEALRRDYAALRADRDDAQLIMEVLSADLARLRGAAAASPLAKADTER